jgi:hypothetical protein
MNKLIIAILVASTIGCANISPLSPRNNNRINNQNGTLEDIKNNQNGVMADLANVRSKLELMARDVENIQQGFMNSNNRNYGVQIFQGEGGLIAGVALIAVLGLLVLNYRSKAEKYKKTAEIMGREIRSLRNKDLENNIFMSALSDKVEENVYNILRKQN